jgi:hypothetical protein
MPEDTSTPEFHLGLTMAGAASAGCYTAGAMDYLFEMLDLWEKAKNNQLPADWGTEIYKYIPQHKVTIDAMGGTSAGGMTTIMSSIYALKGVIKPVNDPQDKAKRKNNVLYDSWVLMDDDEAADKPKLFEKIFANNDLDDTGKIGSLLNSDFINVICENAFKDDTPQKNKPAYISDNLEVVLSHTILRSIPLAVNFTTPSAIGRKNHENPEHNTFDHFITTHYKLKYDETSDAGKYLPLDPFGPGSTTMKLATKATGAFPVGLRFREFFKNELSKAYLQHNAETIVFDTRTTAQPPDKPIINWPKNFPDPFNFIGIDGGAVNNEPYGEVLAILKKRYGLKQPGSDYKYALVMIDPFPDIVPAKTYKQPEDLFSVVPAIIGSLWDQSKLKRAEMLDAYSNDYYRGEIYPARWKKVNDKYEKEDYPIACGAAMAFSGFLDIDFRHHDFFLGRDNARNFYRAYFTLEYDPEKGIVHPIHKSWTKEMIQYFKMPGKDGSCYLPIIPDMLLLKQKVENTFKDPHARTVKDWPQYDPEKLFSLRSKMDARIIKMLGLTYSKLTAEKEEKKNPETKKWLEQYYHSNLWKRFTSWAISGVLRGLFNSNKANIATRMTKMAIDWILSDLEEKGLLKKTDS